MVWGRNRLSSGVEVINVKNIDLSESWFINCKMKRWCSRKISRFAQDENCQKTVNARFPMAYLKQSEKIDYTTESWEIYSNFIQNFIFPHQTYKSLWHTRSSRMYYTNRETIQYCSKRSQPNNQFSTSSTPLRDKNFSDLSASSSVFKLLKIIYYYRHR